MVTEVRQQPGDNPIGHLVGNETLEFLGLVSAWRWHPSSREHVIHGRVQALYGRILECWWSCNRRRRGSGHCGQLNRNRKSVGVLQVNHLAQRLRVQMHEYRRSLRRWLRSDLLRLQLRRLLVSILRLSGSIVVNWRQTNLNDFPGVWGSNGECFVEISFHSGGSISTSGTGTAWTVVAHKHCDSIPKRRIMSDSWRIVPQRSTSIGKRARPQEAFVLPSVQARFQDLRKRFPRQLVTGVVWLWVCWFGLAGVRDCARLIEFLQLWDNLVDFDSWTSEIGESSLDIRAHFRGSETFRWIQREHGSNELDRLRAAGTRVAVDETGRSVLEKCCIGPLAKLFNTYSGIV